jgi:GT2 family glycosyltransferase
MPNEEEPGTWRLEPMDAAPHWPALSLEVLVIDSASSDGSAAMVRLEFPGVRLWARDTNLGYAAGNNLGMRQSRGRYVLILNPDTEVLDDALGVMLSYMDNHLDVGALGPQLLWPDGSVQSSRRRFPSLHTALVDSTFLEKWAPAHPALRHYRVLDRPDDVISEVDWVTGSCVLARRPAIEQVGPLDDSFFMYSEELDWQKRMKDNGWKVVYLPAAKVVHHHGKSSEQVVAQTHIRFSESKVRYYRKHHGALAGQVVRCWLTLNYIYEWSVETLKWCLGHRRDLRRERMSTYQQVLKSGFKG